ncbi:hypothetical protein [Cellulophaga sp. BC115SP]|uniref:hypothetical protein n=1 Tax=Cellulophaga sp. BC115SP TaxID=2683263 RepID=UPI0014134396|nr:hypothetical protein [Cellulophaga sp. BC115SP]
MKRKAIHNPQNEVITLASKTPRTNGTEKVYNLEIYRDHNFLVGNGGLLVHNSVCLLASLVLGSLNNWELQFKLNLQKINF